MGLERLLLGRVIRGGGGVEESVASVGHSYSGLVTSNRKATYLSSYYLGVAAKYRNAVSSPDLQSGSNARA